MLTKLIADSKKGAYNRQLPGNLAELPDAYVFPELLRAGAVERDLFARIEVTYTVEMGAAAVDPATRAILFSDKVTISEKRNKTETRGGAKNVYEDLVAKAVDRLAARLAAFFLKRGRILRADGGDDLYQPRLATRHQTGRPLHRPYGRARGRTVRGRTAEEEGLAEFDLDAKGTIEILEVRENAAKAKLTEPTRPRSRRVTPCAGSSIKAMRRRKYRIRHHDQDNSNTQDGCPACCSSSFARLWSSAQTPKRVVRIFLDVRETNLEKPSTVAANTISERLSRGRLSCDDQPARCRDDHRRNDRFALDSVTDDVKREGGVNAEASASVRLLVGEK